MKKREKEEIDFSILRPSQSYLDDISGLLDEAEKAANDLMKETSKHTGTVNAPKAEKAEDAPPPKPDLDQLLKELDELVGLKKVKENVHSLINLVKVRKLRQERELPTPTMSLHLVFMGNPGTGKTTVARLVAQLYYSIGVISKGQLVEVDRSGLVAGYVGQTAIKTKEAIDKALGGVLFIDEAYSLTNTQNGQTDFGREAIDTILKAMEDHRDDFVVIVAGYDELMEEFIHSNPGLESRFNRYIFFDDYTGEELMDIFRLRCKKNSYKLDEEAERFAIEMFNRLYAQRDENFGNAREVRNFFENCVAVHSDRIAPMENPTDEEITTFKKEDLEKAAAM